MIAAAFPAINLTILHAIVNGIVRAGGFPVTPPPWRESYAAMSTNVASAPLSLSHPVVSPGLPDGDLMDIIIDLQENSTPAPAPTMIVGDPGTPLRDELTYASSLMEQ